MKTKKDTPEPLILGQDDQLFSRILKDINEYYPLLSKVVTTYSQLEMKDFDDKIFKGILSDGTAKLEAKYYRKIEKEITKAGITSTPLKDSMKKTASGTFEAFKTAVEELISFRPYWAEIQKRPALPLHCITYSAKAWNFIITDQDEEKVMNQFCRIFIKTEEEHRLYNALEKFNNAHKDFLKEIKPLGVSLHLTEIANWLITYDDQKPEVRPDAVAALFRLKRNNDLKKKVF